MASETRILVVDDDPAVQNFMEKFLTAEGYAPTIAADGASMRQAMAEREFDLLIVDLMLPGEDGLSLVRGVRGASDIPVIMLTGKGDPIDKVVGLEMGADDYVTKPFDNRELLARIRSLLRRSSARAATAAPVEDKSEGEAAARFLDWRLDFAARELANGDGAPVHLTTHEFDLLSELVRRAKKAVSREQLLDSVSHRDWDPMNRSVDVTIGKLRRKLNDDPKSPFIIKTIRGVGYMFAAPVEFE